LDLSSTVIPAILTSTSSITLTGTVSGIEGQVISLYAALNKDYTRLTSVTLRSPFPLSLLGLSLRFGVNLLEVWAVDSGGTFSNPSLFYFVINEGSSSDVLIPNVILPSTGETFILKSSSGSRSYEVKFKAHYRTDSRAGFISSVNTNYISSSGLNITSKLITVGSTAVVGFSVTGIRSTSESLSISLIGYLNMNGNYGPLCEGFEDQTGFSVLESDVRLKFFLRKHTNVIDVDSYWYGSSDDLAENVWKNVSSRIVGGSNTAISITWQNRLVSSNNPLVLWAMIGMQEPSTPPTLVITASSIPAQESLFNSLTVSGSVSDAQNNAVDVFVLVDGRIDKLFLGTRLNLPGESQFAFQVLFQADLGLVTGLHTFVFYAIDSTGAISAPSRRFSVNIVAPTKTPTATILRPRTARPTVTILPTATKTPSPSISLAPHLDMSCSSSSSSFVFRGAEPFGYNLAELTLQYTSEWSVSNSIAVSWSYLAHGPVAIVQLKVTNSGRVPLAGRILFQSQPRSLVSGGSSVGFGLPSLSGVKIADLSAELYLFCRNHPLVTDVDSYWFGSSVDGYSSRYTQIEGENLTCPIGFLALSWQDRMIPAYGMKVLRFVVRWGRGSIPPRLNMTTSSIPSHVSFNTLLRFRGWVTDGNGQDLSSVYGVINGDLGIQRLIASESVQWKHFFL
jgi:hypothetical protein